MTKMYEEEEQCALCRKTCKTIWISSTSIFGSPDLDSRPAALARTTIDYWITRCPTCGYCAPRISKGSKKYKEIIRSEKYLRQLKNKRFPKLVNSFLCWSIIQEEVGNYAAAGWGALHAAWVCDDIGADDRAISCRRRAIRLFQQAQKEGVRFAASRLTKDEQAKNTGAEEAILADLFRRTGQFEKVLRICVIGLSKEPTDVIRQVLLYQLTLAGNEDRRCYNINQAIKHAKVS